MPHARARPRRDLAVAGHVNIDRMLRVRQFPGPDRTVGITSSSVELGGTATNLARVAARGGVAVGLLSRLGDGFPPEFRGLLERSGIDLGGVRTVRGRSTPTCFVVVDDRGAQRTLIDQGPMEHAGTAAVPRTWLRRYAWLHIGTGPPDFQLRLAEVARAEGLRVAADPAQEIFYRWNPRQLLRLLEMSEILFGNRQEIEQARRMTGTPNVPRLTEIVPCVVRTEGARGVTLFSRTGASHAPAERPRSLRSLVGAGDAFRGGFYAAFFAGEPLAACVGAGQRAACRWVEGAR
jgi:sugar/nucleoside kinase (ribokinase family)